MFGIGLTILAVVQFPLHLLLDVQDARPLLLGRRIAEPFATIGSFDSTRLRFSSYDDDNN
jgi:hypothetical protein